MTLVLFVITVDKKPDYLYPTFNDVNSGKSLRGTEGNGTEKKRQIRAELFIGKLETSKQRRQIAPKKHNCYSILNQREWRIDNNIFTPTCSAIDCKCPKS